MAESAQQQISDVLALIRELGGRVARTETIADVFAEALPVLHRYVAFDLVVAVMLEQTLELHLAMRETSVALVNEALIARIRETLEQIIPLSFKTTDVVIRSETMLTGAPASEGDLAESSYAAIEVEGRTAGLLVAFRATDGFSVTEHQILEIFSAQIAMFIAQIHARRQIQSLADMDHLTGISNKRAFSIKLPQEIGRARVYGVPLSLLMIDIDDFKLINDTFGHPMGDVVLSEVCAAIRETLRPPDFFARYGGDEFALILPHTDLPGAVAVAERILRKLGALNIQDTDDGSICCSVSIGISTLRDDDGVQADLMKRADERLYDAKRSGKNRLMF